MAGKVLNIKVCSPRLNDSVGQALKLHSGLLSSLREGPLWSVDRNKARNLLLLIQFTVTPHKINEIHETKKAYFSLFHCAIYFILT